MYLFFKVPWPFDVIRSSKHTADDEELCCLLEVEPAFLCLVAVGGFQQISVNIVTRHRVARTQKTNMSLSARLLSFGLLVTRGTLVFFKLLCAGGASVTAELPSTCDDMQS